MLCVPRREGDILFDLGLDAFPPVPLASEEPGAASPPAQTQILTSAGNSLLRAKNGLDNGVHRNNRLRGPVAQKSSYSLWNLICHRSPVFSRGSRHPGYRSELRTEACGGLLLRRIVRLSWAAQISSWRCRRLTNRRQLPRSLPKTAGPKLRLVSGLAGQAFLTGQYRPVRTRLTATAESA